MPLTCRPTEGFGRDQFGVFDGDRKIGRIYKTERSDWFWGLDWLAAGEKLLTDHPGTHEEAMARFEATWERVDRKGIAKLARGQAPSHEEAMAKFEAAWAEVMDGTE